MLGFVCHVFLGLRRIKPAEQKGTENVIKGCIELTIPYLVYTSSPSVVYDGGGGGTDESLPYPKKFDAYYPATKAIAEQVVLKANSSLLATCSLRPHLTSTTPRDPDHPSDI